MGNIKNVNGELIKRYGIIEEGNWRKQMTVRFDMDYNYLHIQLEHTVVTLQVM